MQKLQTTRQFRWGRWPLGSLTMAIPVAALAFSLATAPAVAQEKPVTLRVASFIPAQGFLNVAVVQPYLEKVAAASNGTLEFDFFPGGTMGRAPAQQLSLVQEGTVDMAVVLPAYQPGAFEAYNVTQLPGVAASAEAASVGAWHAFEAGQLPSPDGVRVLGIVTTASNILHMKKPVNTLANLAGRKVRAAGSIQVSTVTKLGAAVVGNLAGPEIAEGLSRNLLDGTLMDWIGIKEFRVDRLAPYHTEVDFGRLAIILPINQARFDSLPDAAKAALVQNGGMAFAQDGGGAFDDAVQSFRSDYLASGDHQAISLSDADMKTIDTTFSEVIKEWVAEDPTRDKVLSTYRDGAESIN